MPRTTSIPTVIDWGGVGGGGGGGWGSVGGELSSVDRMGRSAGIILGETLPFEESSSRWSPHLFNYKENFDLVRFTDTELILLQ